MFAYLINYLYLCNVNKIQTSKLRDYGNYRIKQRESKQEYGNESCLGYPQKKGRRHHC